MKYSYHWLQEHIATPLPSAEELARVVTIKAFEVEGVEQTPDGDTVFDIKVLPDRAHDALSHRGMAREIAALFELKEKAVVRVPPPVADSVSSVEVAIEDSTRCMRYVGVRVDNVSIGNSSDSIINKLTHIGSRAINNIVDLTNIILFDLGQPMHAFDAAKVVGGITIRLAREGETMTTLDGKALIFDGGELVIADDEGVLALAGIKGGKKAEVDTHTTSIIFESANFDAAGTRRTSTRHGIKTDASKRFENGMTSALAGEAMTHALALVKEICPDVKVGNITDVYPSPESAPTTITITLREINSLLGAAMSAGDIEDILGRCLGWTYAKNEAPEELDHVYTVTIPDLRLDLRITEDLIEEIGRHYGYERITPTLPKLPGKGLPNKHLYYANKIRNFLVARGFSEVYTYSFASKGEGEIEVMNPVGKDRPFMRHSLLPGISRALAQNLYNAPLLQIEDVKIFELGNVFAENGETTRLALGGIGGTKKRWKTLEDEFRTTVNELYHMFEMSGGREELKSEAQEGVIELDFDAMIAALPEPTSSEPLYSGAPQVVYETLSPYPFIVRDVALWMPKETDAGNVEEVVRRNAGSLAKKISLFDTFEKEDRKSLAFRMVLQSDDRTLTDDEANVVYDRVVSALREANATWEVRV